MEPQQRGIKSVYTVVERAPGKSFWTRVGVGFVNQDGSLNLRLDAIPTNGTLQVRDWEPREGERRASEGELPAVRKAPRPALDHA
jgi:hypothetical protein